MYTSFDNNKVMLSIIITGVDLHELFNTLLFELQPNWLLVGAVDWVPRTVVREVVGSRQFKSSGPTNPLHFQKNIS